MLPSVIMVAVCALSVVLSVRAVVVQLATVYQELLDRV